MQRQGLTCLYIWHIYICRPYCVYMSVQVWRYLCTPPCTPTYLYSDAYTYTDTHLSTHTETNRPRVADKSAGIMRGQHGMSAHTHIRCRVIAGKATRIVISHVLGIHSHHDTHTHSHLMRQPTISPHHTTPRTTQRVPDMLAFASRWA